MQWVVIAVIVAGIVYVLKMRVKRFNVSGILLEIYRVASVALLLYVLSKFSEFSPIIKLIGIQFQAFITVGILLINVVVASIAIFYRKQCVKAGAL